MKLVEELRLLRARALEALKIEDSIMTYNGKTTREKLCALLEPNWVCYEFRTRGYHVIQINPDGTHYAYCAQGDEICHITNSVLPTEVLCILVDALGNENDSYDFDTFEKNTCYTDMYQDKIVVEIRK